MAEVVKHVKAHAAKKEREEVYAALRVCRPKASKKLGRWQKHGAMLDEEFRSEAKRKLCFQQEREEREHQALQYAASFHVLEANRYRL